MMLRKNRPPNAERDDTATAILNGEAASGHEGMNQDRVKKRLQKLHPSAIDYTVFFR
jgi:hypothetical protein